MGKVIITLRVLPEGSDINTEDLVDKIKHAISEIGGEYLQHFEKPLAFGINTLEIKFVYPDKEFKEEALLEKINSIEGVSSVEVINVTLSSI